MKFQRFNSDKTRILLERGIKIETKKCQTCKRELPLAMFSKNKRAKDGLQKVCKDCQKQYYKDNKEKMRDYKRNYAKINSEKVLADGREYFYKNIKIFKQYRRENAERINEYSKMWRKNNVEKTRVYSKERNEKMMSLPHTLTEEEWQYALKEFNYKCAYCGDDSNLEKDHFVPISKDGGYTIDNIIPSCINCNRSKYNYDFFDWYINQDFYDKEREIHILNYLGYIVN